MQMRMQMQMFVLLVVLRDVTRWSREREKKLRENNNNNDDTKAAAAAAIPVTKQINTYTHLHVRHILYTNVRITYMHVQSASTVQSEYSSI